MKVANEEDLASIGGAYELREGWALRLFVAGSLLSFRRFGAAVDARWSISEVP